jgi:RNA polymerase sigma-70 factor (ECF subfamily)
MSMTDEEIISLYFDRSEEALAATQRKYDGYCRAIVGRILGSARDAEEIISDTWLKAWLSIPPNRPRDLKLYLAKIGRNLALKRLRYDTAQRRCPDYELSLEELEGCIGSANLQDEIDARMLGRAIDRFLDTIPANARILFLRRYWFGDSVKDIAKDQGMTQNAVSVSLSRSREKLRAYLLKEGFSV